MGLFGKVFNQKQESSNEEVKEERVKEITPEIQELINKEEWEEIFENKVYDVYDTFDVREMQLKIFDIFCSKYPNLEEEARIFLWSGCSSLKGYYEVPVNVYIHDGQFDAEYYDKTCDLHNYNPMLNLIRDAKDIKFTPEHIICLNNMWADGELKEYDFFKEVSNWLDDPSLFIEGKDSEETRKLILLKKYEGGISK